MHTASSLLLSPLIAQYIYTLASTVYNNDQPRETISYKVWHTHSQSINTFYKGEKYGKWNLCVFILNAFYLKEKLRYIASSTPTSTIPTYWNAIYIFLFPPFNWHVPLTKPIMSVFNTLDSGEFYILAKFWNIAFSPLFIHNVSKYMECFMHSMYTELF